MHRSLHSGMPGLARLRRLASLLAAIPFASGCATLLANEAPPAVFDSLTSHVRTTTELASIAKRMTLAEGVPARVLELARDADTSQHLVAIRDREPLHRHNHHSLNVVILKGHGAMHLGGEERLVGEGSVLHVPRGVVHAFINRSNEPAVAYVLYSPPFDGVDRELVPASN